MLDRLTHRCHILEASGESYRLKDARRRSSGKKVAETPAKPPEKDQSTPTNYPMQPALPSGRGAFFLSLNPGVTIASSFIPSATLFNRPTPHFSTGVYTTAQYGLKG